MSSATHVVGWGRAETLALLCEMATRNAVRDPNAILHQKKGRGRGLQSLPLAHPTLYLLMLAPWAWEEPEVRILVLAHVLTPYVCPEHMVQMFKSTQGYF